MNELYEEDRRLIERWSALLSADLIDNPESKPQLKAMEILEARETFVFPKKSEEKQ